MTQEQLTQLTQGVAVYKKGYFIQTENEFVNSKEYNIYEKMVYMSLNTYAGKSNNSFPSQKNMASNLGISVRSVIYALESLEKKNGIVRIPRVTETGRKTTCLYYLADINPITGKFEEESLRMAKILAEKPIVVPEYFE